MVVYITIEDGVTAPDKIIVQRKSKEYIDTYVYINDTGQAKREKR
jgi:hypothetical protein